MNKYVKFSIILIYPRWILTVELPPVSPWITHRCKGQKGSSRRSEYINKIKYQKLPYKEKEKHFFQLYLTLLFAAACAATNRIESGDTVRKKPAI